MVKAEPLNVAEEVVWRSFMRIALFLPRRLDGDLVRAVAITASEYTTLMAVAEAVDRELRMTDLANAVTLSASRMSRLIDDLQARGLVTKRASANDGRGSVAGLTPAGWAKVRSARGIHLLSVRDLVFDHIDPAALERAAQALSDIALPWSDRR
jgi:DNA-binding MarR family transcriptional regulator